MDIKAHGTALPPRGILKNSNSKKKSATNAPTENSRYKIPDIFSNLAKDDRHATVLPTGSRLPWAERRAALQSKDPALNDTQRVRKIPQTKMAADPATEPTKKGRRNTKSVGFDETTYLLHDCEDKEQLYENATSYQLFIGYAPTVFVVAGLKPDETSYYRENQYTSAVARPILLEDTEQPDEAQTSGEPEEIKGIAPTEESEATDRVTLPEGAAFSSVFSRSPEGCETKGKSGWRRPDPYESKWLALFSRARRSDKDMKDLLDQHTDDMQLLESTEKTEIGNQLIPLQQAVSEMQEFRDKEKTNLSFTDKKARKETRTPREVYGPLRSKILSIQNSKRPNIEELSIALAEFAFTVGSESDKSIADAGKKAIKNIIKTRETLMRKHAPKA